MLNRFYERFAYALATMLRDNIQTRKPRRDRMAWLKFRASQEASASQNSV